MRVMKLLGVITVLGLLLGACSPAITTPGATATTMPSSTPVVTLPPSPTGTPTKSGTGSTGKNIPESAAVTAAVKKLAQQLSIDESKVKVVKAETVQWPDGCLGIHRPGIMCTMMVTPGYRVLLEAGGQQYEFHTNLTGETVVQAGQLMPKTEDKVVVWEQTVNGQCSRAEIGEQGVAYGMCDGELKEVKLEPARAADLSYLLAVYQPFSGGTKAGTVSFNGQGQQEASAAEIRSVAEWASLVNMEAQGGRSGAAWGGGHWLAPGGRHCGSLQRSHHLSHGLGHAQLLQTGPSQSAQQLSPFGG